MSRWIAAALLVATTAGAAHGGKIVLDDFSAPDSPAVFVLTLTDPVALLIKQSGSGIIGGERDVYIDVLGPASPISASGSLGNGSFLFSSSSPGSVVTLQYDGSGPGDTDTSAGLVNNEGLLLDLVSASHFALDFLSLDAGPGEDDVSFTISVTGLFGEAVYDGAIQESIAPFTHTVDLSDFSLSGGFSWQEVTSVEFVINADGMQDVDFELDELYVKVPEPAAASLFALTVAGVWTRRRRR